MLEAVLDLIDKALGVKPPAEAPGVPADSAKHEKISDYYREIHGDMRALRETEQKFVALFYQVLAFVFAGNMAVVASASTKLVPQLRILIAVVSVLFLVTFWLSVHRRIAHDHKSYAFLMSRKNSIEAHWYGDSFGSRPPHLGSKPAGSGYRKSQGLIAFTTILIATLIGLACIWSVPPLPWTK